jgi:hypothetical protein
VGVAGDVGVDERDESEGEELSMLMMREEGDMTVDGSLCWTLLFALTMDWKRCDLSSPLPTMKSCGSVGTSESRADAHCDENNDDVAPTATKEERRQDRLD